MCQCQDRVYLRSVRMIHQDELESRIMIRSSDVLVVSPLPPEIGKNGFRQDGEACALKCQLTNVK